MKKTDALFGSIGTGAVLLFMLFLTYPGLIRLAFAACSNTANLGLCRPQVGDSGWGASLNNNFDLIDAQLPALSSGDLKLTTNATCGTGYTEYTAARGRFLIGVPASGTNGGTVGTALTDLQDKTHTHTYTDVVNHVHSIAPPTTSVSITDSGHTHGENVKRNAGANEGPQETTASDITVGSNVSTASAVTGITASVSIAAFNSANPTGGVATGTTATTALSSFLGYIQLRLCQKS